MKLIVSRSGVISNTYTYRCNVYLSVATLRSIYIYPDIELRSQNCLSI